MTRQVLRRKADRDWALFLIFVLHLLQIAAVATAAIYFYQGGWAGGIAGKTAKSSGTVGMGWVCVVVALFLTVGTMYARGFLYAARHDAGKEYWWEKDWFVE